KSTGGRGKKCRLEDLCFNGKGKMRKLFLFMAFLMLMARTAAAELVTIGASHDATIYSGSLNSSNGGGPGMFAGTDGTPQTLRSLIEFDVAGAVPAGATITSVQLTL